MCFIVSIHYSFSVSCVPLTNMSWLPKASILVLCIIELCHSFICVHEGIINGREYLLFLIVAVNMLL